MFLKYKWLYNYLKFTQYLIFAYCSFLLFPFAIFYTFNGQNFQNWPVILNSFLFCMFNMKILEKDKFSEGWYSVFSKIQCVSVTIAKLRSPTLLDTFFLQKRLLNSLPGEVHQQKSLFCPSDFPSHLSCFPWLSRDNCSFHIITVDPHVTAAVYNFHLPAM